MIPENIHTIPRAASWNSEGEGNGLEFQRHGGGGGGGVTQFGIPKAWKGLSSELSEFTISVKDSLEIADLLTDHGSRT